MITVNDEFNLLPELFTMSDEFVRVDYWEKHEVDITACYNEELTKSDVLTVFINAEPDRQQAIEGAWDNVRKMRPNNIFLVAEIDNQHWPFETMFYPSWLKATLDLNKDFTYTVNEKEFLADALLGGMSPLHTSYRNDIVAKLDKKELLQLSLIHI